MKIWAIKLSQDIVFEQPLAQKQVFWALEISILQTLGSFWQTKLKAFSGIVRQSVPDYLSQTLVIGSFLENCFGPTLSSKTNVLSVWKKDFPFFCKFLSDEFETIFCKSEAKSSKLFKSKFGHQNLLRKWFWSNLELKNECSECLKKTFSNFLQVFQWRSWNHFLGKLGKAFETI